MPFFISILTNLLGSVLAAGVGFLLLYGMIRILLSLSPGTHEPTEQKSVEQKPVVLLIQEIKKRLAEKPDLTARELLDELERERASDVPVVPTPAEPAEEGKTIRQATTTVPTVQWSNWYAENSINLLLFVGAFLIVATASILVGFQWQTITGLTKSLLISGASVFFLVCGVGLYNNRKVRIAGAAFAGIGTILIPFVGFAWYTFVLRDLGYSLGMVWTATSVLSVLVSLGVSMRVAHPLFTYIATFGLLSSALGLMNAFELKPGYYLLSSQVCAIIILTIRWLIPKNRESDRLYSGPMKFYGDTAVPVTIIYGVLYTATYSYLMTVETGVAVWFAGLYYIIVYMKEQRPSQLLPPEILLPFGLYLVLRGLHVDYPQCYVVVGSASLLYIAAAELLLSAKKKEEADATGFMALLVPVFLYIFSSVHAFSAETQTILALLPAVASLILWLFFDYDLYTIPLTIFLAIALKTGIREWMNMKHSDVLGYSYLYLGELWYTAKIILPAGRPQKHQLIRLSTIACFVFAVLTPHTSVWYLPVISAVITVTLFHSAWYFREQAIYIGAFAGLYWFAYNIAHVYALEPSGVVTIFTGLSYVLYTVSYGLPIPWQYGTRISASLGQLVSSFGYGMAEYVVPNYKHDMFLIYNAYAGVMFFCIDWIVRNSSRAAYFASFVGVSALTWHLHIFGITDSLVYTCLWGTYCMVLGYLRRNAKDESTAGLLDVAGIALILAPAFTKSFTYNGQTAAYVMGGYGLLFIITGLTRNHRASTSSGVIAVVAAVLSQTYSYIFGLEKWIITGILAVVFLATAFFLLVKRKE